MTDIRTRFGISNSSYSPDILQNSDEGISNFWISGQSFIKKNCHNSRTSNYIDIKFGPITKLDKKNRLTLRKFDYDLVLSNCDVIVILQFMANLEQSGSWIPMHGL